MPRILRRILAVLAGIVVAFVVVMLTDLLVGGIFPPPPGTDVRDPESMAAAIGAMPVIALALMVIGWGVASAVGAFVAVRITPERRRSAGHLVALLLLIATMANLAMLPHPAWMWVAALIAVPLLGWVGARMGAGGADERVILA